MAYYNKQETEKRVQKVVKLLNDKDIDVAIIYFDELNVANKKVETNESVIKSLNAEIEKLKNGKKN